MTKKFPYHILNTMMIAGGVGFMLNMLNLVHFLMEVRILHFLILIGAAVLIKLLYGLINSKVKDPLTAHPIARKLFYLGMGVLALALVLRTYNIPYYSWLLYLDIIIQVFALGVSFSAISPSKEELNEEILDNR